jgi:CelD/BcsL family acetyltransferase involved in cellulose biosynthesis
LLERSFPPTFQYEFEWVSAWTEYLRKDWKPFLLTIKEKEKIIGIFPLMYRDEKRRGLFPFRRIKFLGADYTDYSVVLSGNESMMTVIKASLDWLFSGKLRWELLILDDLLEGNPAIDVIRKWIRNNCHSSRYAEHTGKYFHIDLTRSMEEILKEASKDFVRRNIKWARNRISKSGQWEVIINPDWHVETIISKASRIHIKRQVELGRQSFFSDKLSREYIRCVLEISKSRSIIRTYWLRFENVDIAYIIGFEKGDTFFAWNVAFDSEFGHFSPSKLLFFEAIKDCHDKKLKEFSFMRGESDYKTKWTNHFRGNYRFIIKNTAHLYGKLIFYLEKMFNKKLYQR